MKKYQIIAWFAAIATVFILGPVKCMGVESGIENKAAGGMLQRVAIIDPGDSVVFDLSKATHAGTSVYFPVSILSDDTINSLDFSFKYDHTELSYDSIHNLTAYIQPLSYYNALDSTVRFTSFSIQAYAKGVTLVTVHFTMLGSQLDSADLNTIVVYLNGNTCSNKLINPFPSAVHDIVKNGLVKIYPNPSNGQVTVEVSEKVCVQVLDKAGRCVYFERVVAANSKHYLPLTDMPAGIYLVRVFNERFSKIEKIAINQ